MSPTATGGILRWIKLENYKSIGRCAVELTPLTLLVGRNAAGKSNFVDALRFVVEALEHSLDRAVRSRGGLGGIRHRGAPPSEGVTIELQIDLGSGRFATYGMTLVERRDHGFRIAWERAKVWVEGGRSMAEFVREASEAGRPRVQVTLAGAPLDDPPPVLADRLYLVHASGREEFRPLYDALLAMGFYNLEPAVMRELQQPDAGSLLRHDGANIASVLARLGDEMPEALERLEDFLAAIVPGVEAIGRIAVGTRETVQFWMTVEGAERPVPFEASSMSDGTLRALGVLLAANQRIDGRWLSLVAVEEPEAALHPAAAGALMDALREAATHTQILVTSHGADLLDQFEADEESLLVVVSDNGTTRIAPVDPVSRGAIADHLYSAGELLRMDQLRPDEEDLALQERVDLFDPAPTPVL